MGTASGLCPQGGAVLRRGDGRGLSLGLPGGPSQPSHGGSPFPTWGLAGAGAVQGPPHTPGAALSCPPPRPQRALWGEITGAPWRGTGPQLSLRMSLGRRPPCGPSALPKRKCSGREGPAWWAVGPPGTPRWWPAWTTQPSMAAPPSTAQRRPPRPGSPALCTPTLRSSAGPARALPLRSPPPWGALVSSGARTPRPLGTGRNPGRQLHPLLPVSLGSQRPFPPNRPGPRLRSPAVHPALWPPVASAKGEPGPHRDVPKSHRPVPVGVTFPGNGAFADGQDDLIGVSPDPM